MVDFDKILSSFLTLLGTVVALLIYRVLSKFLRIATDPETPTKLVRAFSTRDVLAIIGPGIAASLSKDVFFDSEKAEEADPEGMDVETL